MRRDDEIGVLAAGDGNGDGRREAAGRSPTVDNLPDGAGVDGVALKGFDEGFFELGGSNSVEDLEKPGGSAPDIVATLGDNSKERLAASRRTSESV